MRTEGPAAPGRPGSPSGPISPSDPGRPGRPRSPSRPRSPYTQHTHTLTQCRVDRWTYSRYNAVRLEMMTLYYTCEWRKIHNREFY